jgi:hypothetical protein
VTDAVLKVGDTRRRPVRENTPLVDRVLGVLEAARVAWAPRFLGIDEDDREILSWLPGRAVTSSAEIDLAVIARMVRQLHDLTEGLVVGDECVIHDDLQPRNVVVAGDGSIGLIDWEQTRPGGRVEDLAGLCWSFCEPFDGQTVREVSDRWKLVVDTYGLPEPDQLVPTMLRRMLRCADDIHRNAAAGSARHQALLERGDAAGITAAHDWVEAHADALVRGWR